MICPDKRKEVTNLQGISQLLALKMENTTLPSVKYRLVSIFLIAAILVLFFAIYSARWPLLLTLVGIGIGALVSPAFHFLNTKASIPKGVSGLLFLILWGAIVFGIGYLIYILVAGQFSQLSQKLPSLIDLGQNRLADYLDYFPSLSSLVRKFNWTALADTSAKSVAHGIQMGTEVITGSIFLIAVSIYTATESNRYLLSVLTLFPKDSHKRISDILYKLGSVLRSWFFAQLIAMACVGACASIGFLIINLDYWLALGFLTSILDIVPFVGPTIAAICACLVALGSDPQKVPWVILTFVIVEHIESNLVIPIVLKGKVDLPPVHLLTIMFVFSQWFGILGIVIAPPILAILRALYLMIYVPFINRQSR